MLTAYTVITCQVQHGRFYLPANIRYLQNARLPWQALGKYVDSGFLYGASMGNKRRIPPPVIAIFGRISIERGYCKYCQSEAFIKDNCLLCCGSIAPKKPKKYKRVSDTSQRRKKPSPEVQQRILLEQLFKCFYCEKPFGALQARGREAFLLEITWDHRLPYVLFKNSDDDNFVAACQVCNSLKHDIVFETAEDARFYLAHQRLKKGFNY